MTRWVISALLGLLTGCVRVPLPQLPREQLNAKETAKLIAALKARTAEVQTFKGLARTEVRYQDQLAVLRHAIIVGEGGALRIDTLAPGSSYTLGLLVARGDTVRYLDTGKKLAYEGAGKSLVTRSLGVPLAAEEVAAYINARIPEKQLAGDALRAYRDGEGGEVVLVQDDLRTVWRIDPATMLLDEVDIRSGFNRKPLLTIRYDRLVDVDGVRVPQYLAIDLLQRGAAVSVAFSSQAVNVPAAPTLFDVPVPSEYRLRTEREEL